MVSKRFCSSSNQTADVALQNQYDGLLPRVLSLWSLTDDKGIEQMSTLVKNKVVVPERPLNAIWLYADLQNPLLQKYKFDPLDFVKGAKHAYIKVIAAISSVNFSNYSNGFAAQSDDHALLCAVLHPTIYDACIEAAKSLHKAGIFTTMTGNEVSSVTITRVVTNVVTAEVLERRELARKQKEEEARIDEDSSLQSEDALKEEKPSASPSAPSSGAMGAVHEMRGQEAAPTSAASATHAASSEDDSRVKVVDDLLKMEAATSKEEEAAVAGMKATSPESATATEGVTDDMGPEDEEYPEGSVLATVDVLCESTEKYQTRFTEGEDVQSERQSFATWTLRGCISGHVELNWKVVAFDGLGNKHF